jgi:hypothetical protein
MIYKEVKWACPAQDGRDESGAWCNDVPCRGHRTTRLQRQAARVLAWSDGWDHMPFDLVGGYLASAAEALAVIGDQE